MCGIAGVISLKGKKIEQHRLKAMTDTLVHRGPEHEGIWMNDNATVAFGHRRLSIIDLTTSGSQPMHYLKHFTITYNGEIYNYIELRDELIKKGYTFHSNSDTEVILAAYACYGNECLQKMDGMFAFAIWDEKEQQLFCARDRFGEKPFFFYQTEDELVFASEMKALWAVGCSRQMDNSMLLHYLTTGTTFNASNSFATFYSNIHKLPRAHYLTVELNRNNQQPSFHVNAYWDIDKETTIDINEDEATEMFYHLFTQSIKRRLRSDVPVGTSLSGGLDSSSIVAVINQLLQTSQHQKTFSAIFPGFEKDESKQIDEVVKKFGIESFTTTPTADGLINDFEKLVYHQEEPFQSSSIYAQYKVYELAKQNGVTVLLDGQGADETLAGYHKYYHWYWQQLIAAKQWKQAKKEIASAKALGILTPWGLKNYVAAYVPSFTASRLEKRVWSQVKGHPFITNDFKSFANRQMISKPAVERLNDILYFNTMQNGLEELLRYADRNSMAHSREVRLPFLDHSLVEFVFSLPAHYKIKDGWTKWILRQTMSKRLPQDIVWRKDKTGFEPPQKQWMQQKQMQEYIHEAKKKLVTAGILQQAVLSKPIQVQHAHEAGNYDWRYLCAARCL